MFRLSRLIAFSIYPFTDVDKHIFKDLTDASGLNALTELEEILLNMPKALALMKRVDKNIETLSFYIAQYRDGIDYILCLFYFIYDYIFLI